MVNPGWSKAKYAARDVHLDQDTAGRLLESMGDHTPREMIVRTVPSVRQNPAYRPIAYCIQITSERITLGGYLFPFYTLSHF
jgi:hypothetical protein